jgi:tetratricopeptide (TPR) repeat protein
MNSPPDLFRIGQTSGLPVSFCFRDRSVSAQAQDQSPRQLAGQMPAPMQNEFIHRLCLVVFLSLCFSLWSFAQSPPSPSPSPRQKAELALNEGSRLFQAGNLEAAIGKFREAYQILPQHPLVRLNLANALYQKDKASREGQQLMESVLDQFPEDAELSLRLLHSYLASQATTKVISLIERLKGRMEGDSRLAFNVIYTLIPFGQIELARTLTGRTSDLLQGEVLFISGLLAVQSGQKELALEMFERAESHQFPPPGSRHQINLAESCFALQNFAKAGRAYEDYLAHFPGNQHRFRLGLCYFATGQYAKAEEQFKQAMKVKPLPPEANYHMGATLIELKRSEEARPYLEAELKLNPSSFRAQTKLAYLDYLKGENESCLQRLDQSAALDARWFETHLVRGMLLARRGDYPQALQSLQIALREEPNYWKTHFQLSQVYDRLGNPEKAKEYLASYNRLLNAITKGELESRRTTIMPSSTETAPK